MTVGDGAGEDEDRSEEEGAAPGVIRSSVSGGEEEDRTGTAGTICGACGRAIPDRGGTPAAFPAGADGRACGAAATPHSAPPPARTAARTMTPAARKLLLLTCICTGPFFLAAIFLPRAVPGCRGPGG